MRLSVFPSRVGMLGVAIAALGASACAYRMPEADPADIPSLQAGIEADPTNTDLQVQLGMAEYKAEDFERARTTLQAAVDSGNESGAGLLYLGLTEEHFDNWSAARDNYTHYLQVGQEGALKDELHKRLELIAQNALKQQAEQALARESELSNAPPTPRSVAIFPFGFNSDRQDLQPLVFALSDMMITDFAVSNALTVLERAQIQSLLDEMALTEAGYAEPGTGARAGRLLRAEHVVQGVISTFGQDELRLDTDVLDIPRGSSAGTLTAQDQLQNLFSMEKDLVFRTLRDVLGVELTPAEEQQIRDNRADNILAFLAYGRGLRERDRGNFEGALQQFQQAQQLDPGFGAASAAVSATSDMSSAAASGTAGVQQTASTSGKPVAPPTSSGNGPPGSTLGGVSEGVNPTPTSSTLDLGSTTGNSSENASGTNERDPTQESQGQEGVTSQPKAQIRIVIRRPGGGQ